MPADVNEEQVLGKAYDARLMRRLLTYIRPYRGSAYLAIACLFLGSAFSIVQPYLTKVAIDRYIKNNNLAGLNQIAILYIGTLILVLGLSFAQTWLINLMGQKIMRDLRMEIFRHLQKLDVAFFDKNPVGRLMTRVTTDVDVLNELFTAGVISFSETFSAFGNRRCHCCASTRNLPWPSSAVIPLIFVATLIFKIKVRDSYRWVRTCIAQINAFLQENITGMAVVQIFVQEKRKFAKFTRNNREHLDANLQSISYYAIFYPVLDLLGAVAIGLIIWYGGGQVLAGTLTLGALVAFLQYSDRFFRPISDLSEKYTILQAAMASSERIFKLLDTAAIDRAAHGSEGVAEVQTGSVEFRNVTFCLQSRRTGAAGHLLQRWKPGEKVALVGATGAGKSTIIALLSRFYDVQPGRNPDRRTWT